MHHVITLIEEAVENRVLDLTFSNTEGATVSTSCDLTKTAKWHG
jgi:hypothetical protein